MDEQKLLKMYEIVHGEATGCFEHVVVYHENSYGAIASIDLIKDGNSPCGSTSVEEIMFDYLTREWD